MRDGWVETTIGEVSSFNSVRKNPKEQIANSIFIGLEHLESNQTVINQIGSIENVTSPVTPFESGDVLFGRLRPYLHKVAFASFSGFCSPEILALRANDKILPKMLLLICDSESTIKTCIEMSAGTRMPRTSTSDLASIKISIPSVHEQKRIVDLISSLDSYLEVLQKQIEGAKKSRTAVLHKIFHTDINAWPLKRLDECAEKISDGSHNPPKGIEISDFLMLSSKDVWDGKLTNLDPRYLQESDFILEHKRTELEIGDVLLTIVGTIGRCAVYLGQPKNVTFQRSVCVIKPNKSILNETFLMLFLQSIQKQLDQEARGVAQRGIYLNQIRSLQIPTPTIREQRETIEAIEALDEVINLNIELIKKTQTLRTGLLFDLLSGEHEIPSSYDKVMGAAS
jgi:restriction endonuclease S subunit